MVGAGQASPQYKQDFSPQTTALQGALGGTETPQGLGRVTPVTAGQSQPSAISGQDPFAYMAGMQRRNEGSGFGGSMTGGIGQGASYGATVGSIVPVIGTTIGGIVGGALGGIGNALSRNASTATTDFSTQDALKGVGQAYQSYLGREGSQDELMGHLQNQGLKPGGQWVGEQGMGAVLQAIQNSPEAQAYAMQQALGTQPTEQPIPGDELTPLPKAVPSVGQYRGQLEGFASNKLDSAHQSPKYTFARLAQNYDVKDPAQREQLLAALKADPSGYFKDASWGGANKDRLVVGGQLDPKFGGINTFDVIRNAAGGGDAWQWGPEDGNAAPAAGNLLQGPSTQPNVFSAGLSNGLQQKVDLSDPTYAQQLIQYLMGQLALGGSLK